MEVSVSKGIVSTSDIDIANVAVGWLYFSQFCEMLLISQ